MKVRYKREMRHNYLILDALEANADSFEIRMLERNAIDGILKFRIKQEEADSFFCYEITSKQPLSRLLEFSEIKREEISRLILGIGSILNRIEPFLLQEGNILLEPDHIYIEPETYQVWLCYVPGYQGDFPKAMEKLLQFLLKKADHRDSDTVVLAYRLYQESQKDYYGIEDLLKAVQESQKESFSEEWPEKAAFLENSDLKEETSDQKPPDHMFRKMYGEDEDSGKDKFLDDSFCKERYENIQRPNSNIKLKAKQRKLKRNIRENQQKGKKVIIKKESKFAVQIMLFFALGGPVAVWFTAGETGLRRYGGILLAADGILLIVCGWILLAKKKAGKQRRVSGAANSKRNDAETEILESNPTESKWYMTFREDEKEEWSHEILPDHIKEQTEIEPNKDTVLLAEMDLSEKKSHFMKSLDPSVEDISVSYFPFIIGKQEGIVDYVLKKPTVSRLHIRIDKEAGICRITDLNSSNGTIVANHSLEANETCQINSGDKIQIADLSYIFY